jgi:DNA repair protein SbcC/Rad50
MKSRRSSRTICGRSRRLATIAPKNLPEPKEIFSRRRRNIRLPSKHPNQSMLDARRLSLNSMHGLPGSPLKADVTSIVLLFRRCFPETTPGSPPGAPCFDALENTTSKAEGALSAHKKAFEDHIAARPTIDDEAKIEADLVQLRSAQAELIRRRDAARTPLHADDQLQATRVSLARQLESRRSAFVPWEKLNELIGSADGAKFRSIAQRRTLDLPLRYANVQLNQIAGRYVLARVPESLNLVVLDRDMGEERRSVHTLSGGEMFLVSLALALGLASLTSNRLRIESLFIDEGFGSLDPETLNTAMGALMSLEAQGRKVGIISHVPEMADAIPVQIRVVKGRNGASRIVVPGAAPK